MMRGDQPGQAPGRTLVEINERSREIFRQIVDSYLATGEPVGSRNLSRILPMSLSPASVRNVMADLEAAGLIYAPHTSAGRLPTELGLRFFVDAMLEIGDVSAEDRAARSRRRCAAAARPHPRSGAGRGLGAALRPVARRGRRRSPPRRTRRLKHIEFVRLDPARALVVLVAEDGSVENRVVDLPAGLPASALTEA